ncbi:MAG TPA: hypothetical protein VGK52_09555 [Polyangia bacterium]|jgi:hypothetical protein
MAEPFDWMLAKRNPEVARAQKARREAMYRTELEDRAGLLSRLGYSKENARTRLQANVRWDFEGGKAPVAAGDVDAIIDRAFGGNGPAGKPAGRPKAGSR